ncbi:dihydropteroate synthase [Cereibacter sphaeroides]|nr:dihydropteroate synthase [Cereibacter sphaeroides]
MRIPFADAPTARTDWPRAAGALPLAGSSHVWFEGMAPSGALLARAKPILPALPVDRPLVMGIVNVTPDSFSDGGTLGSVAEAVARARAQVEAGADILDIGGESTRPGAAEVPVVDEIARTAPVIAAIRAEGISTPISIDTRKAGVAEAALKAGADIVNDVSALTWDADLARVTAEFGAPICLMHAQGTPQTMQADPRYDDVLREVYDWLGARMDHAVAQGIAPEKIITDVGIGFGKTLQHNLTLLKGLALFHGLGAPVLLGASRKRFIGTLSGVDEAAARMPGSLAVALHAAAQGAQIIRVHDVAETVQALALWRALTLEDDV